MLGDWGGERRRLAEKGVTFDFHYVADLQSNHTGGEKQTQADGGAYAARLTWTSGEWSARPGLDFTRPESGNLGVNLGA
jgi:carbohydrate-selective porin OprB